jgi:hypothetical protein
MSQNFANHAKVVPQFHFFVGPALILNVVWTAVRLVRHLSLENGELFLVAVALLLLAFNARLFALRVQDRIIRLEMRMRMKELLPTDLQPRIEEFSLGQLISLRFASDAELPTLARKVLDERINDRKVIKKMVQNWQADELRA